MSNTLVPKRAIEMTKGIFDWAEMVNKKPPDPPDRSVERNLNQLLRDLEEFYKISREELRYQVAKWLMLELHWDHAYKEACKNDKL